MATATHYLKHQPLEKHFKHYVLVEQKLGAPNKYLHFVFQKKSSSVERILARLRLSVFVPNPARSLFLVTCGRVARFWYIFMLMVSLP